MELNPEVAAEATPRPLLRAATPPRSSSERLLGLLDLFTVESPSWTVEAMAAALGLSRTTAYRYARTLVDTGFLMSLNAGTYVLGARIIELDRTIRLADPMLHVAPPIMEAIRERAAGVQVLCSYYGDHVMCIHDVRVDTGIESGYERGRPFTLFRGAPSRIILPYLPTHQLKQLMLHHGPEIAAAGLGQTWPEFNRHMKRIRADGYFAAPGELHPGAFGISAPVMHTKGIAGSLTIGWRQATLKEREIPSLIRLVVDTAAAISAGIQRI